jgi:transcriptional regulator with XRE-family HTH domain
LPERIPSPFSLALTYLRSSAGWSQTRLARALGLPNSLLSAYERGAKPLTRERLDSLIKPLGRPPEAVDVFLAAHRLVYPQTHQETSMALSPEDRRTIDRAALAAGTTAGQIAADNVRGDLIRKLSQERTEAARSKAEKLFRRLLPLTPDQRKALIEAFPDYWSWALAVRMCEAAAKSSARQPEESLEFAELAVSIAERSPGDDRWRTLLKGYCWAHLGSALQFADDLAGAEEAFERARSLWWADAADSAPQLREDSVLFLMEASSWLGQLPPGKVGLILDALRPAEESNHGAAR